MYNVGIEREMENREKAFVLPKTLTSLKRLCIHSPSIKRSLVQFNMDKPVKYGPSIQANTKTLQYVQDFTSLMFGTLAGILQLESSHGFIFFIASSLLTSVLYLVVVVGGNGREFYESPLKNVFFDNLTRGLTAFLMSWTLFYALVQS
jgi:hypothetical protein